MNATVMAVQLFCVVALAALAASAPVPRTTRQTQASVSYIFNAARGNYLEIAESGEIDANGDFGTFQYYFILGLRTYSNYTHVYACTYSPSI